MWRNKVIDVRFLDLGEIERDDTWNCILVNIEYLREHQYDCEFQNKTIQMYQLILNALSLDTTKSSLNNDWKT